MNAGPGLDQAIHHPSRLSVMAFLSGCAEAEFAAVRDELDLTDANLSRITALLETEGYLLVRKGRVGRRPRTWLALSDRGRTALADHLEVLHRLVETSREAGRRTAAGPGTDVSATGPAA